MEPLPRVAISGSGTAFIRQIATVTHGPRQGTFA